MYIKEICMAENKTTKKVVRAKNAEVQEKVQEENVVQQEKQAKVVTIKAKTSVKKQNATHNVKDVAQKAPVWAYWTFIPLAFVLVLGLVIFMIVSAGSVK